MYQKWLFPQAVAEIIFTKPVKRFFTVPTGFCFLKKKQVKNFRNKKILAPIDISM